MKNSLYGVKNSRIGTVAETLDNPLFTNMIRLFLIVVLSLGGYIWKTEEYPWLNMWRHVDEGKPLARGLEFGTTGLHQPFPVLIKKARIFGRPILAHLDAGESVAKSYAAFLFRIPGDYRGVASVSYAGGRLTLRERGAGPERNLEMEAGELFPE